jgi:uncharacterized protein (TIGR00297 family)
MYPRLNTTVKQTLNGELKRQSAYISLGLLALLFPFIPKWLIVLGVFLGTLAILYTPKTSFVFQIFASERDREAGVLLGPLKFCFAILLLAILMVALDFPIYVMAATIGMVAFGEGAATVVNMLVSRNKAAFWSVTLLILGTVFGFVFGAWAMVNTGYSGNDELNTMFFLSVLGTVTGALLYTIVDEDNIAIPLGAGMAMWLFSSLTYTAPNPIAIVVAVAFPLAIGMASYKLNAADLSGALAGVLSGLLMIVFGGISWFLLLLVFFFLGTIFTKYKYTYKRKIGAAQLNEGSRGYRNVFGNCLPPLIFVVAYGAVGNIDLPYVGVIDKSIFLIGYLAAMATATGDTLASEIGSTYRSQPRMITTLKKVNAGTDGAISLLGEFAALGGCVAIALVAYLTGVTGPNVAAAISLAVLGGFLGTNIDSVLGATLQQRKILTNEGVNLYATLIGGLLAMALYYLLVL